MFKRPYAKTCRLVTIPSVRGTSLFCWRLVPLTEGMVTSLQNMTADLQCHHALSIDYIRGTDRSATIVLSDPQFNHSRCRGISIWGANSCSLQHWFIRVCTLSGRGLGPSLFGGEYPCKWHIRKFISKITNLTVPLSSDGFPPHYPLDLRHTGKHARCRCYKQAPL